MKMSTQIINPILRHTLTPSPTSLHIIYFNNSKNQIKNKKLLHKLYLRRCLKFDSYGVNPIYSPRNDITYRQMCDRFYGTDLDLSNLQPQSHNWTVWIYKKFFSATGIHLDNIIIVLTAMGGGTLIGTAIASRSSKARRCFYLCCGLLLLYFDRSISFEYMATLEEIITHYIVDFNLTPSDVERLFEMVSKSANSERMRSFFDGNEAQVGADEAMGILRMLIDSINNFKDTPFGKKLYKLVMYIVSFGFSSFLGFDFAPHLFSYVEQKEVKMKYNSKLGFFLSLFDSVLFLAERGKACFDSASLSPLIVTVPGASEWCKLVSTLKVQYKYIANPEPHNFTWFGFLSNLDHAVDMGQNIMRACTSASDMERRHYMKMMDEIKMMRADVISKKSAQKSRRAPFGILLSGSSSVAKSCFCSLMIHHYSKVFDLPNGDEFRYTRNANSDFWDGFTSSMWAVILDDIAYLKPMNQPDPTLTEMLQVVNNASFVPNQADLDNKGRTPLKARLVIATTNTEHLNAHAYFACPVAIQRRLRYVVSIRPKPEYLADDGLMINSSSLPTHVEGYPDYWIITVKLVQSGQDNRAHISVLKDYDNIYDFLLWFNSVAHEHEKNQDQSDVCDKVMREIALCATCQLPLSACKCCEECNKLVDECICCDETFCSSCVKLHTECDCTFCTLCEYRVGECTCCVTCWNLLDECNCVETKFCPRCILPHVDEFSPCQCTYCPTCYYWSKDCECENPQVGDEEDEFISAEENSNVSGMEDPDPVDAEYWSSSMSESSDASTDTVTSSLFNWDNVRKLKNRMCRRGTGFFPKFCLHCYVCNLYNYTYYGAAIMYTRWAWPQRFFHFLGFEIPMPYIRYSWSRRERDDKRIRNVVKYTACAIGIAGVICIGNAYFKAKKETDTIPQCQADCPPECIIDQPEKDEPQSVPREREALVDKYGGSPITVAKPEKESIWKKDDYCLTRMDVNHRSTSNAKCSITEFTNVVANNLVYLRVDDFFFHAICLTGNLYVANNHCFPIIDFKMDIITVAGDASVCGNVRGKHFDESLLQRVPEKDLVFFTLNCLPPRRCLLDYLPQDTLRANMDGYSIARNELGIIETIAVRNLRLIPDHVHSSEIKKTLVTINSKTDMWFGSVSSPTRTGHCGAMCVGFSSLGPVILGLHFLGGGPVAGAIALTKDFVKKFVPKYNVVPGIPQVSAPDCERTFATELHFKSPLRYVAGVGNVYGSYTGFRTRPKSSVEYTLLHPFLKEHNELPIAYAKPMMNGWLPWHNALKPMVEKPTKMSLTVLAECSTSYLERLRKLPNYGKLKVQQLDILSAINGQNGVRFIDSINRSTSMGEPYNHSKKMHLRRIDPYSDCSDPVIFDDINMEKIAEIQSCYARGERVCPIFHASLKDEALKLQKVIDGKTRVFSGGPASWSIVVRMMLLPIVKVLQDNQAISEIAVGVTAQSLQWEKLRDILTVYGENKLIAGDYQNYDKSMIAELILSSFEILAAVLEENGCSKEQVHSVFAIGYDVAFAYTNFNGDLVEFFGSNPSGQPLTVIINCIVNSLLIRYAYKVSNPHKNLDGFNENVSLLTYGDDNAMGVSDNVPWFNHTSIQKSLGDIGIVYTMADKNAPSIPYIHIDEVSFLKRVWRFDEDIGAFVCPLELASIEKMLNVSVASKTITRGAQMAAIVCSAMGEYFWYGRAIFEKKRELLKRLMSEADLDMYVEEHTFPTWKQLRDNFWNASKDLSTRRLDALKIKPQLSESYCFGTLIAQCGHNENGSDNFPARAIPEISIQRCVAGHKIEHTCASMSQGCTLQRLGNLCSKKQKTSIDSSTRCGKPVRSDTISTHYDSDGERCTCKGFQGACCREIFKEYYGPQVGEVATTMEFLDDKTGDSVSLYEGTDGRVLTTEISSVGLESYLSRPVKILTFTWNESDPLATVRSVFPWSAFLSNTNIAYKLNNYSFIRCTLKIKIMINASPFYYGSMIAAYTPLQTDRPDTSGLSASTKSFIPLSQKPHVWLNPQDNNGAEMSLPFLYHKDWINAQSNDDLINMGVIHFVNYNLLQSANGVSGTGCTVSVYAWAEDVHLAGPSAGLAAQVGEIAQVGDEYGDKPISSIASAIAARAGSLTKIPVLGKYATATEMGAKAIASVATRLGFCNPPVIDNVMPYRPTPFPNQASSEISYPVDKLTFDPKSELAIDPTIAGASNRDELTITGFCARESYLTSTTWDTTRATDTILFHAAVSPLLYDSVVATNYETIYATPMAHTSQMFRYWRGDLTFRFRIIASKYHKGRLRFTFDPTGQGSNNIVNLASTQPTCFTQIIDLSEESDVAIRVPYMQALPWLRTFRYVDTTSTAWWSTSDTPLFLADPEYTNGSITLRVVNALTSPVASSAVTIQCFVSATNLEFAGPRNLFQPLSYFEPQVGEIVAGTSLDPPSERYLSNFGEAIVSFRQLFRRAALNWTFRELSAGSATVITTISGSRLPRCGGYTSTGRATVNSIVTSGPKPFEFANMIPLTWITQCFVGVRGSTNWTFNVYGSNQIPHLRYVRDQTSDVGYQTSSLGNALTLSGFQFYSMCPYNSNSIFMSVGNSGAALTNQRTNDGLNISHPMYNNRLMEFVTPTLWNTPAPSGSGYDSSNLNLGTLEMVSQDSSQRNVIEAYVSSGTDYNPIFFLNVPRVFLYKTIPEP